MPMNFVALKQMHRISYTKMKIVVELSLGVIRRSNRSFLCFSRHIRECLFGHVHLG